jgi:hypothetical protein
VTSRPGNARPLRRRSRFPVEPDTWTPPLANIFAPAPRAQARWLASGPVPDCTHLLVRDDVDGMSAGPWVLLDGYVQESSSHQWQTFTFLRGVFMATADVESMHAEISDLGHLGNDRIPDGGADHYTYAGKVPWSSRLARTCADVTGRARRHTESAPYYLRPYRGWHGIARVEIRVHRWNWETYHSELNQASGITFPAPAVCEHLGLRNHGGTFDLGLAPSGPVLHWVSSAQGRGDGSDDRGLRNEEPERGSVQRVIGHPDGSYRSIPTTRCGMTPARTRTRSTGPSSVTYAAPTRDSESAVGATFRSESHPCRPRVVLAPVQVGTPPGRSLLEPHFDGQRRIA